MSGFWARTLVYLGLREEPEDHIEWDVLAAADAAQEEVVAVAPARAVRPVQPPPRAAESVADVRPLRGVPDDGAGADRVAVVHLRTFDDIEAAGRAHRDGRPVLLDLTGADRTDGQRAIDFLSGVLYVTEGALRRVAPGVFLLLPHGVGLSDAERTRLTRLGYAVGSGGGDGR